MQASISPTRTTDCRWKSGIAKCVLCGQQLSPPENKFGKGYEHGKKQFSTEIWTVVLVRIIRFAILKRLAPGMFRILTLGRRSGGPQRNWLTRPKKVYRSNLSLNMANRSPDCIIRIGLHGCLARLTCALPLISPHRILVSCRTCFKLFLFIEQWVLNSKRMRYSWHYA